MKVQELFNLAIEIGMINDPRGSEEIQRCLVSRRNKHDRLEPFERELIDPETLEHPYDDSRILHLAIDEDIGLILVSIDGDRRVLNTAKHMGIETCWSHHPHGALTGLPTVMEIQKAVMLAAGMPDGVIDKLMAPRVEEVIRRVLPIDTEDSIAAARQLGISLLATHTPADNCVHTFLQQVLGRDKPRTLGDLLKILLEFPEYRHAAKIRQGCQIIVGKNSHTVGNFILMMTGGTEGPVEIYKHLVNAGISTAIGMHFSEEHVNAAKEAGINLVIAGHTYSDTVGMNLLMDEIERRTEEELQIVTGFLRVRRNKGFDDLKGNIISQ